MRKSGKRLVAVAPGRQIEIMTLLLEKGDNAQDQERALQRLSESV